jgi:AcrR family transcriptional regulator
MNSTQQQPKAVRVRSRLPREKRVSDILAAAREVIAERGYENAVIADIADRAGVVEGTIYRYFENKRDLFIRVAEGWYEEILRDMRPSQAVGGTFNRLRQMIWRELDLIRQQPALTRFILMELRSDPAYRSMRMFELNRAFTAGIMDLLKEGVESGEFTASIPLRVARDMIFGGIEHRTWAFLRSEGDFSVDESADAIAQIVYRGLSTRGADGGDPLDRAVARLEAIADRLAPEPRR